MPLSLPNRPQTGANVLTKQVPTRTLLFFFLGRLVILCSPVGSDEDAAGSLRSEIGGAGREEDEQLLHHGADVGGRHQRQREVQRSAAETGQTVVRSVVQRRQAVLTYSLVFITVAKLMM